MPSGGVTERQACRSHTRKFQKWGVTDEAGWEQNTLEETTAGPHDYLAEPPSFLAPQQALAHVIHRTIKLLTAM